MVINAANAVAPKAIKGERIIIADVSNVVMMKV
jgi:hypothetical protein